MSNWGLKELWEAQADSQGLLFLFPAAAFPQGLLLAKMTEPRMARGWLLAGRAGPEARQAPLSK